MLLLDVCRCVIRSHTPLITLGLLGSCGSGAGAEGLGQAVRAWGAPGRTWGRLEPRPKT